MRILPPGLAAHLAEGATTLARCWRLTRRDGAVLGFTDHDRDLAFGGTVFAARTGLEAAEATTEAGFAVGGGEVSGALVSAGITEDDIAAGLYDGAAVETWLVDWSAVENRLLLDIGTIGEVRRADQGFIAEVRGPTHRLDEERGRLYTGPCSAELGDARCRVDLADPAFVGEGAVEAADGDAAFRASGLDAFAEGWFDGGRLAWTGGANVGSAVEVKLHRVLAEGVLVALWARPSRPMAPGDTFRVTAGCDKRLATCRDKFANLLNHRGFPHLPGNDFVLRPARQGEPGMDGGSLFQ